LASRRSHLFLIALILAALVGVGLLAYPSSPYHRSLREGLDLQGGLEVVLQAAPFTNGVKLTSADMTRSISIMNNRVNKLGVSEPQIQQQGSNQIVIQLPAVHNQNQAAAIIGKTAQLELYDLTPSLYGPSVNASQTPVPDTSLFDLLTVVQTGQKGAPSAYDLFNSRSKAFVASDATLAALKQDPVVKQLSPLGAKRVTVHTTKCKFATGSKAQKACLASNGGSATSTTSKLEQPPKTTPGFPRGFEVLIVPPKTTVVTCDSTVAVACPGLSSAPLAGTTYYYLFKHGAYPNDPESPYPQMTGSDLELSGTQADVDPSSGLPIVTMQFTGKGNRLFHEITRFEAQRGQALGVQQSFAIVLDNQIYSFPTIDYSQYADGIDPTGTGRRSPGSPRRRRPET
jgi:preprotein translocase subunit SecD